MLRLPVGAESTINSGLQFLWVDFTRQPGGEAVSGSMDEDNLRPANAEPLMVQRPTKQIQANLQVQAFYGPI